jgi:hypothetical protein
MMLSDINTILISPNLGCGNNKRKLTNSDSKGKVSSSGRKKTKIHFNSSIDYCAKFTSTNAANFVISRAFVHKLRTLFFANDCFCTIILCHCVTSGEKKRFGFSHGL